QIILISLCKTFICVIQPLQLTKSTVCQFCLLIFLLAFAITDTLNAFLLHAGKVRLLLWHWSYVERGGVNAADKLGNSNMLVATKEPMDLAKIRQIDAVDGCCCRSLVVKVKVLEPFAWRCGFVVVILF